jgi:hypothetical protein
MNEDNVVVMDGPGPFYFGRLEAPIRLLPVDKAGAVAIEGEMEIDDAGRRVVVRIPMAKGDFEELCRALRENGSSP